LDKKLSNYQVDCFFLSTHTLNHSQSNTECANVNIHVEDAGLLSAVLIIILEILIVDIVTPGQERYIQFLCSK